MKRKILVLAITLALASCSSSDDTAEPTGDVTTSSDPNPGSDNTDNDTVTGNGSAVNDPVALELVGQDLLVSLAGFQADKLSLSVRNLAVEIAAAGEAMPLQESTFETLNGFGPEVVVSPTQITAYTCNAGGQMMHAVGRLRNGVGTDRSLRGDYDAFTFDACRHLDAGGVFAPGNYEMDGELVMHAVDYSANRGSRSSHSNSWAGFSMSAPADLGYELAGSVVASAYSAADFGTGDARTVELPTYRKTSAAQTTESLEDARLTLNRTIPNGSNDSSYQLDADGITVSPATGGLAVTINTDPPLSGRRVDSQGMAEPFSGQIRMVAADGGELILSANAASQISIAPGDLLVDLIALRPNGESITNDALPLIDILSGAVDRGCFIDDTTGSECGTLELP